jgi:hypothetical protein
MGPAFAVEIYPSKRGLMRRRQWRARVVSTSNHFNLFGTTESYNNVEELIDLCERLYPTLPIMVLRENNTVARNIQ